MLHSPRLRISVWSKKHHLLHLWIGVCPRNKYEDPSVVTPHVNIVIRVPLNTAGAYGQVNYIEFSKTYPEGMEHPYLTTIRNQKTISFHVKNHVLC